MLSDAVFGGLKSMIKAVTLVAAFFLFGAHPLFAASSQVMVNGLPDIFLKSATDSISKISDQMFVPPLKSSEYYQKLLERVLSRVFSGYGVRYVVVVPEKNFVSLELFPVVNRVKWDVEIKTPFDDPSLLKIISPEISLLSSFTEKILEGVPVEALNWGESIIARKVREKAAECLLGFSIQLYMVAGDNPKMVLSLVPEPPIVLDVETHLYSRSFPTFFLREMKSDIGEKVRLIEGLPVEWVNRHKEEIVKLIGDNIAGISEFAGWDLEPSARIETDRISTVDLQVESDRWDIRLWGFVWLGEMDRPSEVGIHIGRKAVYMPGLGGELYWEADMELDSLSVKHLTGLWLEVGRNSRLGWEYDWELESGWCRLEYDINRDYYIHARYNYEFDLMEGSLGKRLSEYIAVEIFYDEDRDDNWGIRILGNL